VTDLAAKVNAKSAIRKRKGASARGRARAYVHAQMDAIDRAIKDGQPGTVVSAAMEEIAACNKLELASTLGNNFHVEVADLRELGH
jgi:hypothetical protein